MPYFIAVQRIFDVFFLSVSPSRPTFFFLTCGLYS